LIKNAKSGAYICDKSKTKFVVLELARAILFFLVLVHI